MANPLLPSEILHYEGIISSLRVNELQAILAYFKSPKLGKKQELIHRCIAILKSPNHQAQIIQQISDMNKRPVRPTPYPVPMNRGYNHNGMMNGGYGGGSTMHRAQASLHDQFRPVRGLRPLPLPFYDHVTTLLEPIELPPVSSGIKTQCRQSVTFFVPRERISALFYRAESKPLPRHEIQLRFFNLSGDWQSQELPDDFPLNCTVRLDDQIVQLPNVIPTNKPNVEPKRPSRPVNITPYCQPPRDASRPHRLAVEWTGDKRVWALAVYVVYRVTSDILRDRAVDNENHKQSFDSTREIIIRRLGTGDEDGITMDQLKISLLCPLGKIRMGLPARCRDCTHLQCFDLDLYLKMNEKRPTWKCAVCSGCAPYNRLIIDGYFQRMLQDVDKSTTEVELLRDGSYQTIKEEVLDLSDEDDGVPKINRTPIATSAVTTTANPCHANDIIELSDSDDEDDREMQQAIEASKRLQSVNTPVSAPLATSPQGTSDDSVIIIDLDTPPRQSQPNTNISAANINLPSTSIASTSTLVPIPVKQPSPPALQPVSDYAQPPPSVPSRPPVSNVGMVPNQFQNMMGSNPLSYYQTSQWSQVGQRPGYPIMNTSMSHMQQQSNLLGRHAFTQPTPFSYGTPNSSNSYGQLNLQQVLQTLAQNPNSSFPNYRNQ